MVSYIEEDLLQSGLGYGVVQYLVCQTPLSLYHREERHYLCLPADSVKCMTSLFEDDSKLSSSNTLIVCHVAVIRCISYSIAFVNLVVVM